MTTVHGSTRITLHELRTRVETRDGTDEWVVGRVDTGDFVALPTVAVEVLRLLGEGRTVDQTREHLRTDSGRDIDVASFVAELCVLNFVETIDDAPVAGPSRPRSSLPWLRPAHVRFLLTWPVLAVLATTVLAALVASVAQPRLVPTYHDLLWTSQTSLVLVVNALIAWGIIAVHELAHLATARAAGVPGRISLGTQLQFLVAHTDVSGIWASPRRQRVAVYLAGIAVDLGVAAGAVLLGSVADPQSLAGRLSAAIAVLALVLTSTQLLVFMRTDLYFLLQDLTGSRNLYADGSAYVRWWLRRRLGSVTADPSAALPAGERRAVRVYAWFLLIGTTACLGVAVMVTLPFALTVLARAATGAIAGGTAGRIDGIMAMTIVGGHWVLWCRLWWRRHGHRVRAWWARPRVRTPATRVSTVALFRTSRRR